MLDIVGLLPGLGEPVDAINTAISLRQEQYLDAGLSAASMVPVVGAIPGAGKALRRISAIIRFADTLPAGIRGVLLDLLGGLKDELASLASRKISDIVSGLKRRVNEAADRLRLAVKKKDDASLPGTTGKNVSPTQPVKAQPAPAPPSKKPTIKEPPKAKRRLGRYEMHHAFPKYLGGAIDQTLARIPRKLHYKFHGALDRFKDGKYDRRKSTKAFKGMDPVEITKDLKEFYKHAENGIFKPYLNDFLRAVKESGH